MGREESVVTAVPSPGVATTHLTELVGWSQNCMWEGARGLCVIVCECVSVAGFLHDMRTISYMA